MSGTIGLSILISGFASAVEGDVTGRVLKILTDESDFSECMAFLSVPIANSGANCAGSWVSVGCSGAFGSKSNATSRLSALQLAYVTGTDVRVFVDDTRKANGSCYATRVDNL